MNRKNFHNFIESDNPEYKKSVYQKIECKLNLSAKKVEKKASIWNKFTLKRTVFATMALLVVCLAIIIPLSLRDNDKDNTRYCYTADCEKIDIDCNVKEYALQNNLSILFVDLYDVAEEVITSTYVNKEDNTDVIYFEEIIINGETGDMIKFSFCDISTKVDIFEGYKDNCNNETIIKSKKIFWRYANTASNAWFEHNGYKYYLEILYPSSENVILEIVEAMLP